MSLSASAVERRSMRSRSDVRAHDVAKFVEISGDREVTVVAITSLHVLVNPVYVDCDAVQKLRLNVPTYKRT